MKILLSIKPEFVEKIFNGSKRYEYRKVRFKRENIQTVVVYSTSPVSQIVGEFEIEEVLCQHPERLWETTQNEAGIDEVYFQDYFEGREHAVALKIGTTLLYDNPINPKETYADFVAPQSFRYWNDSADDSTA